MSRPNSQLTPAQQDLLLAALASNSKPNQQSSAVARTGSLDSMSDNGGKNSLQTSPPSGHFDFGPDDSPYLDFDIDGEGDDSYDFDVNGEMIGDLPESAGDLHDKRKSIDGKDDDDEGGGKRRESEDKSGKKPGRKPLTSEPTTVSHTKFLRRRIDLIVDAETQSAESRRSTGIQRTQRKASQRPRSQGRRP